MSDAFDKEGHYYEDSDFALDLNLQDKRKELVYLLDDSTQEHNTSLLETDGTKSGPNDLLEGDDLLVDDTPREKLDRPAVNSSKTENNDQESHDILVNNTEEPIQPSSKNHKHDEGDDILVGNLLRNELVPASIPSSKSESNFHEGHDVLVDSPSRSEGCVHTGTPSFKLESSTLEAHDTLVSPPPSALPLPMWAKADLVGTWLEQSIADFTVKYYPDSVQEFFKNFEAKDKNYCYS